MTEERVVYGELRQWLLACYYTYCQSKLRYDNEWGSGWKEGELEINYAYDQYWNAFDTPIENLMLEVLALVLDAGRGPEVSDRSHRNVIKQLLSENKLEDLLLDIPPEEAKELLEDMKLLKIV